MTLIAALDNAPTLEKEIGRPLDGSAGSEHEHALRGPGAGAAIPDRHVPIPSISNLSSHCDGLSSRSSEWPGFQTRATRASGFKT